MVEERGRSASKGGSLRKVRRSLSRSKKGSSGSASVNGEGKSVKTSKIKKMMKGLTRKKKSSSSVSDNMSAAVSVQPDDMSVTSAPQSNPGATASNGGKAVTLQLVLLLMDPTTRRFELLQLEFDSDKARVSDIIAQIPISVTEASIKNQQYDGVVDATGTTMNEFVRLVDFCKGKTVLVALPKGLSVKECVRLARPILCDKQVEKMVGWKKKKEESGTKSRGAVEEPSSSPAEPSASVSGEKTKEKGIFPTIAMMVLVVSILVGGNMFLSAPIKVGTTLKPGTWKSKCGLLGLLPPLPLEKFEFLPQCTNAFLEVHNDGTVSIKDAEKELDVLMTGEVCGEDDESCSQGLVLEDDGTVLIGGAQVKTAYVYGEETKALDPWPFAEEPKLKLKSSARR
eukprot:scaffold683_cov124-Cylindrotheca_fusiformis.AAC.22